MSERATRVRHDGPQIYTFESGRPRGMFTPGARRVMRGFVEAMMPTRADAPQLTADHVNSRLEFYLSHFPLHFRLGFPAALEAFNVAAMTMSRSHRPWIFLSVEERREIVAWMSESHNVVAGTFLKAVRGLVNFIYYADPKVEDFIGYKAREHVAEILERHGQWENPLTGAASTMPEGVATMGAAFRYSDERQFADEAGVEERKAA